MESTAVILAALRLHINHTNTLMQSKVQAGMRAMRENDFLPQQEEEEEGDEEGRGRGRRHVTSHGSLTALSTAELAGGLPSDALVRLRFTA